MNKSNFKNKDCEILGVNIDNLCVQYKNIKAQWSAISGEPKKKSGLSPKSVPDWYNIVNPAWSEHMKIMKDGLASGSAVSVTGYLPYDEYQSSIDDDDDDDDDDDRDE